MSALTSRPALAAFTMGLSEVGGLRPLGEMLGRSMDPGAVPTTPAAPAPDTTAVQQRAATQAKQRALARGYRSTILSNQFMPDTPNTLKPTLGS